MKSVALWLVFGALFLAPILNAAWTNYAEVANLSKNWSTTNNNPWQFQYFQANGTRINSTQSCIGTTGSNYQCWQSGEDSQTSVSLYPLTYNISVQVGAGGGAEFPNIALRYTFTQNGNYTINGSDWTKLGGTTNYTVLLNGTSELCSGSIGAVAYLNCNIGQNIPIGAFVELDFGAGTDSFNDWNNFTATVYGFLNIPPAPTYANSTLNYNASDAGQLTNFSVRWNSGVGLSAYIFSFDNGNGTFYNESPNVFQQTNNSLSNFTETLNSTIGSTIRWLWYANDTNNQFNTTEIYSLNTIQRAQLNISVFDEQTPSQSIGFNVTITDGTNQVSYLNQTGTLGLNLSNASIPVGAVTLTFNSGGYTQRSYFLTLNRTSSQNLTVYLLQTANGNNVHFFIHGATAISGATATARLQPANTLIGQATSDSTGTAQIFLSPTSTYIVTFAAAGYSTLVKTFIAPSNVQVYDVSMLSSDNVSAAYSQFNNVTAICVFTNATSTLTCTINNALNNSLNSQLLVSQLNGSGMQQACLITNSSTAVSSCTLSAWNNTYFNWKVSMINDDGSTYIVGSGSFDYRSAVVSWGQFGYLITLFFLLTLAGIGAWNPAVSVMLGVLGLTLAWAIGAFDVGQGGIIGIAVIALLILWKGRT